MKKEEHIDLNRVQIQDEEGRSKPQQNPFPIIGMGGASGSLPAFETFFKHMPAQSGMAFVIVMHQDSKENTDYISLLKSFSSLPILFAADGTKLKPDHIYLAPKDIDVGLHDGHLLLFNASREKGAHMCIDHFFQSLAEDQWNMAVGIVFSGLGADGETGIRMIKEKLGMTMVQDPETAEYPSMPLASIKTQLTDYILPVEEMPMKLIQYLSHPALRASIEEEVDPGKNNRIHVQKILMLLRSHTGHDFSLYKKNTISRRIERRIAFHQLADYEHYVNYLRENPGEVEVLFNELLIGVTKFFRDRQAFDALKERIYALLRNTKKRRADTHLDRRMFYRRRSLFGSHHHYRIP